MILPFAQTTDDRQPIAWQECACLLCGGAHHAPLLEAADRLGDMRFLIVRCNRCGLCFTNPRPDEDSIERFYPAEYDCHIRVRDTHATGPMRGAGSLLDFGCGAGNYLARMHALGWDAVGLDRSETAVARVRERGLTAHVGTLPHPLWSCECFDLITMRQSLEHVHEPLDALRAAYRLLTPGGRLIVAVPNFASLASAWFGPYWFGLDLPRHLTHFTPDTLRLMLAQAGFDQVKLTQERKSGWIRHSVDLVPRRDWRMRLLHSRVGSGLAASWGWLIGAADCLTAVASK